MEDCRLPLFNLILLGVATPYVHNSPIYYDSDGNTLVSSSSLQTRSKTNAIAHQSV
jgi:hypothetical protein